MGLFLDFIVGGIFRSWSSPTSRAWESGRNQASVETQTHAHSSSSGGLSPGVYGRGRLHAIEVYLPNIVQESFVNQLLSFIFERNPIASPFVK